MKPIIPTRAILRCLAISTSFLASPALAFTLDCTSGTGSYSGTSSERGTVILPAGGAVTVMQSKDPSFTIRLDGRTFTGGTEQGVAKACQNSPGGIFEVPYTNGQGDCANWVFDPGDAGNYQVEPAHNETGLVEWTLTCGSAGGGATQTATGPTAQQITTAQTQATRGTQLSAGGQSAGTGSAIGAATGSRLSGSGGVSLSTQGFFLSTSGTTGRFDANWNGWVSLGRRLYDGTALSGSSTGLTLGVDRKLGERALLGLVLSGDDFSLTQGAITSSARSLVAGPYFAAQLGQAQVDGYLAYGRVDVSGGLGTFRSTRTLGGLNVKTSYALGGWTVTPFAGVRGYRDEEPARVVGIVPIAARTVQSVTGALGGTFAYEMSLQNQTVTPYITLAAERTSIDNGLGARSDFTAPRVTLGLTSKGRLGDLAVALEGGEVSNGLRDYGLSVSYVLSF